MEIQKACETLEDLLKRDIHETTILKASEFNALNKVLFELAVKGMYKVTEEEI